jgi:vitamin B12 transporter
MAAPLAGALRPFSGPVFRPFPKSFFQQLLLCQSQVLLSLGFMAGAAHAQSSSLDPVVVTATRTPEQTSRLTADISVVDRDRLGSSASLVDALRFSPGVQFGANGGPGATSSIFIRGANSGQTLLLIEGFRIGSATLGTPSPQGINPALFQSAEVLRGPASSVYGSDAIGGAVNVLAPIAKDGFAIAGEASLGTNQTRTASGQLQAGGPGFGLSLGLAEQRSDGHNATRQGGSAFNPDRDGYRRGSALLSARALLAPGHELALVAYQDTLKTQFDEGAVLADARTRLRSELVGITSRHALAPSLALRLRFGVSSDDLDAVSNFPGRFSTKQNQLGAQIDWQASSALSLGVALERNDQTIRSTNWTGLAPDGKTTDSLRMSVLFNQAAHTVQGSVRFDDDSQFGQKTTGLVGYGYQFASHWRLAGQMSTGFKAASFNDLYFPFYGRPEIRPETSRNAELGLHYKRGDTRNNTQASVVMYQNRVNDLIVYAPVCPDPSPQFAFGCADNVNRANLQGVSFLWAQRMNDTSLRVQADWLDPKDETLDKLLPRRAARTLNISLQQRLNDWRVNADVLAVSSRFDDAANQQSLPGYTLLNLGLQYQFSKQWLLFARANNVFDKRYESAQFFLMPGFNATIGVRYAMQ